jgi:hypothetical protein
MNVFYRNPLADSLLTIQNFTNPQRGYFFYFRTLCLRMQTRFSQLMPLEDVPVVFLHGNPHLENFAIVAQGAGLVDFDRARLGPYSWDIVRFLCSLSLKRSKRDKGFLSDRVLQYFLEGYKRSFSAPELPYKPLSDFLKIKKVNWSLTTTDYLKKNIKWAKKLRQNALPPDDEWVQGVLNAYLTSRNEPQLLQTHYVQEAGQALGSLGNQRVLVVLAPHDQTAHDSVLLDLKTVYQDADTHFFKTPVEHHGERMILASDLYAPRLEEDMGFFTYQEQQYWGRKVPTEAIKLKGWLSEARQTDLAYCVATQLGRAHRLSLKNSLPETLLAHLDANFGQILKVGQQMNEEIMEAHKDYLLRVSQEKNIVLPPRVVKVRKSVKTNKNTKKKQPPTKK